MKARVEGKGPIGPLVFGPPLTFSSAPISGMGPLAGELDELIAVISCRVYLRKVHGSMWAGGEIRSQIDGKSGSPTLDR